jgi:hypothetical protein
VSRKLRRVKCSAWSNLCFQEIARWHYPRRSYDDLDGPWVASMTILSKGGLLSLLPLIGRVEVPSSPILPYAGTGFVVGQGLIATNRHVAQLFSQGLRTHIRYRAGDARSISNDRSMPPTTIAPPIVGSRRGDDPPLLGRGSPLESTIYRQIVCLDCR